MRRGRRDSVGCVLRERKKSVIILPTGSDLPVLFERCLFPVLSGKKNAERKVMNFKLYGADEVELNAKLSELPKSKNIRFRFAPMQLPIRS